MHLDGVSAREKRRRYETVMDLWVANHANHKDLKAYLDAIENGAPEPLPPEALDRMLTSASVGLPEITMDAYLKGRMQ